MASRKEEKERLRREREERERAAASAAQRKRLVGYGIAGALALAVIVVVAVFVLGSGSGEEGSEQRASLYPPDGAVARPGETDVSKAADAAGCQVKEERAKSRDHVGNPAEQIPYSSNPPMTGRHYEIAAEDQAFTEPPPDASVVHSLEHGRVNVWFKPDAPKKVRADLKATYDSEQGYQLLLIPRPNMAYQMAATAWGRKPEPLGTGYLLGCQTVDAQAMTALRAFIDEHRGNGPEPVP
jgi:Protein of unknown function (DUF3105)